MLNFRVFHMLLLDGDEGGQIRLTRDGSSSALSADVMPHGAN